MLSACDGYEPAWYVPAPMDAPDGELVRAIAGRDTAAREAEAELCRRFGPRIRLYGLRHLRGEERARELVQAVLLAVLVAARDGRILDPERVDRFMLGTCRNVALRMKQGEGRTTGVEELEELVAAETDGTPGSSLELGALFECLARLEPRARLVVTRSFQEERPTESIAAELATTPVNVRVMRHRALAALRRCLDARERAEARP